MPTVNLIQGRYVVVDGVELPDHLTSKEAAIFECVMRSNTVVTKEFFLTQVYGGRDEPELKIIDVFICKIKRKLGPHKKMISTVWGRGYARNREYVYDTADVGTVSVDVPMKYLENICLHSGKGAQEAVLELVKAKHKALQELY